MNSGALTGRPCRFASSQWPISWTKINPINPTANQIPPNQR
jgi:hypothetical protein